MCVCLVCKIQIHTVCRSSKSQPSIYDLKVAIQSTDFNNFTQCQILTVHFRSDGVEQLQRATACKYYSRKSSPIIDESYLTKCN
ncbi:hypothetical protein MTR_2g090850 [Medicago truncatula]|uniref:Uncharacterized protein n=1 Tax=Medicago truncatula TaxID=3880 RepID=A0A072VB08_MEDTR|nr:hypothetical protein MTR_2g090850 [Medicago truncatula]